MAQKGIDNRDVDHLGGTILKTTNKNKMARGLKKGQTNNPAGRPKGVPNKVSQDLREAVNSFLDANWDSIQVAFDQLDPVNKLAFIERLLRFSLPVPKAGDFGIMGEQPGDRINIINLGAGIKPPEDDELN